MTSTAQRIAILLPSLAGGGAERCMLQLVQSFHDRGRTVDLLLFRQQGAYLKRIPATANVTVLGPTSNLRGRLSVLRANPGGILAMLRPILLPFNADSNIRHIDALARYLREQQPDALLSAMTYTNLAALWAKQLAHVSTRVIISERIALSSRIGSEGRSRDWRWRHLLPVISRMYRAADGIVAVSNSVASDLARNAFINPGAIKTIYNPVVDAELSRLAGQSLDDPWFQQGQPPVVLGAGRLASQKDFAALLKAFALVRSKMEVRLVILGEGKLRPALEALANELGVATDVKLPGFVENPYRYMANSAVFALTSLYEGLPGVLIQALACGCPVVSTDCPGGSAEILENGRYGRLVPVGNVDELAGALEATLHAPPDRQLLKARAGEFSVEASTAQYLTYLDNSVAHGSR